MRQTFGRWLAGQSQRDDWVGRLAALAANDEDFPIEGDAGAVRAHLSHHQAEPDLFEALDDAELEWLRAA